MRNLKPKLTIDKFTGSGEGLLFYNEGFTAGNENGNSLLDEGYRTIKLFEIGDANFNDGGVNIDEIKNCSFVTKKNSSNVYRLFTAAGRLCVRSRLGTEYNGVVMGTSSEGSYLFGSNSDIFEMASGNLIYTSQNHATLVVRGYCSSGSTNTKIIDGESRDFTALGLSTSSGSNQVMNLKTGKLYTITSISSEGGGTNNVLNFSDGGTSNSSNDEFVAIVLTKFDLSTSRGESFKGGAFQQRQIKQFADRYYILNNKYLARLDGDETTFNSVDKELLTGYEGNCFDVNGSKMIVSATRSNGQSVLLLWDGASDGWNNIIDVGNEIKSIKSYKSGWVYLSQGTLYYTDGFNIEKIATYLDTPDVPISSIEPHNPNSITIKNEIIYIAVNSEPSNRTTAGIYAYDFNSGWSYIPINSYGSMYGNTYSLFVNDATNYIEVFGKGCLYELYSQRNTNPKFNKSAIWLVNLKDETQIYGVGLNIFQQMNSAGINKSTTTDEKEVKITVSIGDGKNGIIYNQQGYVLPVGQFKASLQADIIDVGDQILIQDNNNAVSGERRFITSKVVGSSDISFFVDEDFSDLTGANVETKILKVRKCATKDIKVSDLNKEQLFFLPSSFYSNKLYIEIVVHGGSNSFPISLSDIKVY